MFKYILKRVLYFIPTLFFISLFTFGLSKIAPGDPVELRMAGGLQNGGDSSQQADKLAGEKQYLAMKKKLGLDIPSFYFSFSSSSVSDTMYKITRKNEKETLEDLTAQYGNWPEVQSYYKALKAMEVSSFDIEKNDASYSGLKSFANNYDKLINTSDDKKINLFLGKIEKAINKEVEVEIDSVTKEMQIPLAGIKTSFDNLKASYQSIKDNATQIKNWIPKFSWYGAKNQYHVWLFGNRPWISDIEKVLKSQINVENNEQQFNFEIKEEGYHQLKFDVNIEKPDEEEIESNIVSIEYNINGGKRTANYSYKDLTHKKFKIGGEYWEKESFKKGDLIKITLKSKTSETIKGNLLVTLDRKFNPLKINGGFFRGDFGNSYLDGRPVKSIIWEAVGITVRMNIIAILIGILVSIPLGVKLAKTRGSKFDRVTSILLFILYSLPNFWVATMFIVYFTTPEYGMDWFPTYGLNSQGLEEASFLTRFFDQAHHLILPIIVMTYGAFTYSARQMRGSMIGVMQQDYIRTATAKGLSEKVVTWKHTFRNSLIPIITMFAGILPSLIGGSMIIEIIFNINGMGRAAFTAVLARNYPIMFTVLMFSAILVMISMLLADLMYAAVDPRISFSNKKG